MAMLAGGCDDDDEPIVAQEKPEPTCRMPFPEYSAGPSVAGIELEGAVTTCSRRPSVTYIYGTCHAESDSGCSPPLEVQTWSACHRKPSRASRTAGPDRDVRRGAVTVVIFPRDDRLGDRAEALLRIAKPADPSLTLTRKLRGCGGR